MNGVTDRKYCTTALTISIRIGLFRTLTFVNWGVCKGLEALSRQALQGSFLIG